MIEHITQGRISCHRVKRCNSKAPIHAAQKELKSGLAVCTQHADAISGHCPQRMKVGIQCVAGCLELRPAEF